MTLAIIISPYNAPTAAERAANVRLGIALARWAAAQGYTPIGWWDMIDINDPPDDADPNVRLPALKRDGERARMVGAAGGAIVMPEWMAPTAGMEADQWAHLRGVIEGGPHGGIWRVSLADLTPYLLPEPVPTVPRAAVQAAAIAIESRSYINGDYLACAANCYREALNYIEEETGVMPSEVQ